MTDSFAYQAPLPQSTAIEHTLIQVQAMAGSLFFIFVIFHLSNIFAAPLGLEAFNSYQGALRQVYQHPVVEIGVLMVPLVVHGIAGIWLRVLRRRRGVTPSRGLHFWTGMFLLLFVPGHILAVRGPSLVYGIYPEFEGVAFSLWFMPLWFYPYYFFLGMAGLYHGLNGIARILVRKRVISSPGKLIKPALLVSGIAVAISLMSLGGFFYQTPDPMDNDFARFYMSLMESI